MPPQTPETLQKPTSKSWTRMFVGFPWCAAGVAHPAPQQQRQKLAVNLKGRGNKAYSAKKFTEAIEFYSKAIECEEQAVFYSNRAACAFSL